MPSTPFLRHALVGIAAAAAAVATQAAPVQLTVTLQNLAPANTVSFAPLHVGFHSGVFDPFNNGQAAGAAATSVAEGGAGGAWQAEFQAADPGATRGTIGGALTPGNSVSMSFTVDPTLNPFFSFGAMVVPSNDLFIGNDSPTAFRLFDLNGNLVITTIDQFAADIWDNGSEAADPLNAAFVVGGTNSLRTPQNGVVNFSFAELDVFNGLTTAAGYVFGNTLQSGDAIYRISFQAASTVAEPGALALSLAALLAAAGLGRQRRQRQLTPA